MYTQLLLCVFAVPFLHAAKQGCGKHSEWDKWYDGCNWCICTDKGRECTEKSCYKLPVDLCEPLGEKWRDGAYRCQCVDYGIECIADHRAVHAMRHSPFKCEDKSGCVCGLDGVPSCVADRLSNNVAEVDYSGLNDHQYVSNIPSFTNTYMTSDKMTCREGKRWYSGSKRCFCADNEWEPTCGEPRHIAHRVDGYRLKITQCYTNQKWEYNCKQCMCHMYGLGFCVRIPNCKRSSDRNVIVKKACTVGSRWRDGCKYCKCNSDNKVVCEDTGCNYSGNMAETEVRVKSPNIVLGQTDVKVIAAETSNHDNEKVQNLPDSTEGPILEDFPRFQMIPPPPFGDMDRSFRNNNIPAIKELLCDDKYKPGQIFYDGCNLCTCTHTGDSKCTAVLCP